MKQKKNDGSKGAIVLIICGCLALVLMVACIFFPEQVFGLLLGK